MKETFGAIVLAIVVLATPLAISIAAVADADDPSITVDDNPPVPAPYDFHDEYFDYE